MYSEGGDGAANATAIMLGLPFAAVGKLGDMVGDLVRDLTVRQDMMYDGLGTRGGDVARVENGSMGTAGEAAHHLLDLLEESSGGPDGKG